VRNIFAHYWRICRRWPALALSGIIFRTASGLSEGLALVVLIPILGHAMGEQPSEAGTGAWRNFSAMRGMDQGMGLLFGFGLFCVLGVGAAVLRLLGERATLRMKTRTEQAVRTDTSHGFLNMEWVRFLGLRLGNITDAVVIDGQQVSFGVQAFLSSMGALGVVLVLTLVALFISPQMTLFTVLFGALGVVVFRLGSRVSNRHAKAMREALSFSGAQVADIFGNLKFFRAAGLAQKAKASSEAVFAKYAREYFDCYLTGYKVHFVVEVGGIIFISVFLYLNILVLHKGLAETLIFLAIFSRIAPRLLMAQEHLHLALTYLPWHEQYLQRMAHAQEHLVRANGTGSPSLESELRLCGVCYRYPETPTQVLTDVDLAVPKGSCVAVVGPSGSGKSTLLELVCGLLTPESGTIMLDGKPLPELDLEAWRRRIGLVLQDSPAFHATVLENIAWGEEQPDCGRAEAAARRADAWEFIAGLPEGLDSVIGEKGGRLSGGQRQRLALARALYREPWLLLLDEATSALDGASEAEVQSALAAVKGSCSILLVAHRLKTVQMADHIIVLQDGRIAEQGSWDDLMTRDKGLFRVMAALQGLSGEAADRRLNAL
jgi:ABC-type multidrug transport system fused ATPase/permease subunit